MTDRLVGCTVVFEHDIREDDAERILDAFRMNRHVRAVVPVIRDDPGGIAVMRRNSEIADMLRELAREIVK